MRMIWKIIKYSFLGFAIFVVGKIAIHELFDNRPIKFEKYKTDAQFKAFIREEFLDGSDVHDAIKVLEASNAKCFFETAKESIYPDVHKEAKYVFTCTYQADCISLAPLVTYTVIMQTDANYKIVHLLARRIDDAFVI